MKTEIEKEGFVVKLWKVDSGFGYGTPRLYCGEYSYSGEESIRKFIKRVAHLIRPRLCKEAIAFVLSDTDPEIIEELERQLRLIEEHTDIKIMRQQLPPFPHPEEYPLINADNGSYYMGIERVKEFVNRELSLRKVSGYSYP